MRTPQPRIHSRPLSTGRVPLFTAVIHERVAAPAWGIGDHRAGMSLVCHSLGLLNPRAPDLSVAGIGLSVRGSSASRVTDKASGFASEFSNLGRSLAIRPAMPQFTRKARHSAPCSILFRTEGHHLEPHDSSPDLIFLVQDDSQYYTSY